MSLDRRSFKIGIFAGVFIITGFIIGIVITSRMDWMPIANGETAARAEPVSLTAPEDNFVGVVKAVMPAVVNISTTRVINAQQAPMSPLFNDPFFRQFFGDEFSRRFQMPRERRESSLGSGVIVDASGYIVTNNHVIAKADEIKVVMSDKREYTGKVVGTDPKSDIAVIKIKAKNLPTIPWGNSDKLEVGEYVLAIGNPFGLNQTVTQGIVSAVGRANVGIADYEDFIQTDAAINPGNSGGALVNTRGELVGINTAIFSRSGGYMGIGFAVPSNMTRSVLQSLIETGKVVRGWLGVSIQGLTQNLAKQFDIKDAKGTLVGEVIPDSPAEKAGLQAGDVIIGFDGKDTDNPAVLRNTVAQTPIGKKVPVKLVRDKKVKTINVIVSEQPKDLDQVGSTVETEKEGTALAGLEVRKLTTALKNKLGVPFGTSGVVVTDVDADSSAAASGVRRGDVINELNRMPIRNIADFKRLASKIDKDDGVLLLLTRQSRKMFIVIRP